MIYIPVINSVFWTTGIDMINNLRINQVAPVTIKNNVTPLVRPSLLCQKFDLLRGVDTCHG